MGYKAITVLCCLRLFGGTYTNFLVRTLNQAELE
jgi:hypothetical protein